MADTSSGARSGAPSWWRFSLKQLLITTSLVALGCVALRNANAAWIGAMFGLVWLALAASILMALYRNGQTRAFWIGFALLGWLYLLLPMLPFPNTSGLDPDRLVTTRISHRAHDWLFPQPVPSFGGMMSGGMSMGPSGAGMPDGGSGFGSAMGGDGGMGGSSDGGMSGSADFGGGGPGGMPGMPGMAGMGSMMGSPGGPPGMPAIIAPSQRDFTNVSHALWTLLLAFCGGWFAQWLYASRERQRNTGA